MVQLGEKDQGCKMISGLKKEYPKASKSVYKKLSMSKKIQMQILKMVLRTLKFIKIFLNFKNKLDSLNEKNYLVAVSGGPDSLSLAALAKAYAFSKTVRFHFY